AYVRAGLRVGFLAARCGDGALRPHTVRQTDDAGEPRPRDVVSSAVPRRRMAALCAGFTERAGRARSDPRPDLQARRNAGRVRRAGRLGARTQMTAFAAPRYAVRSTSANWEAYHWVYQRSTHGIGIRNAHPIANSSVRHNISRPLALNMISRCVPATLRQFHRIQAVMTQAQPTMVMAERYSRTCQPT